MTDLRKAAEMALEALERGTTGLAIRAIPALRQALAQPEQETVCDKDPYLCGFVRCQLGKVCKNTAPPSKPWVGLDVKDCRRINRETERDDREDVIQLTETILREKNT